MHPLLARAARTLAAALVLAVVAVPALASPAGAHAVLENSDPAQGAQVAAAPRAVSLRFSEAVEVTARSVRVQDDRGGRVDAGEPSLDPEGTTVTAPLRADLPPGSYTVTWQVVSADGHPLAGSYAFGVGVPAGAPAEAASGTDPSVALLRWAAQLLSYAGVALLLGTGLFAGVVWPRGARAARLRRMVLGGAAATVTGALALLLLQGPYGAGLGLGAVLEGDLIAATAGSASGQLLGLRVLAAVLAATLILSAGQGGQDGQGGENGEGRDGERGQGERGRAPGRPAASEILSGVVTAAVLLATFAFTGHAGQGRPLWLSAGADALHLAAASTWLGGLAALAWVYLPAVTAGREELPGAVLARWSRLAMGAVAVLVVTGTYQAWREVGSLPALSGTPYGRLLLGKVAGLVVLLVLAELGRRWVRRHSAQPGTGAVLRLRESVLCEVAVGVAVLALTALLVSRVPAVQDYAPPFTTTAVARDAESASIRLALDVDPTRAGPQTLRVRASGPDGVELPLTSLTGTLVAPDPDLGPVRVPFEVSGAGAVARDVVLAVPGTWTLTLQASTDPLTTYAATVTYDVK